jgi:hypothetical protein
MVAARFDVLSNQALLPAKDAVEDPVRREIDAAVSNMLEIHKAQSVAKEEISLLTNPESGIANATEILRKLWCAEPSVYGQRRS